MLYRNKLTGTVIDTKCDLAGQDWEAVSPPDPVPIKQPEKEEKQPTKKPATKKTTTKKTSTKKQVKKQ